MNLYRVTNYNVDDGSFEYYQLQPSHLQFIKFLNRTDIGLMNDFGGIPFKDDYDNWYYIIDLDFNGFNEYESDLWVIKVKNIIKTIKRDIKINSIYE